MRTWGRTTDEFGNKTWVLVETDTNGYNDAVYLTALAQEIQLNLGESPVYANNGIPAHQTVVTQVFPDFYVNLIQQRYAAYFASLIITRVQGANPPAYTATAVTHAGATIEAVIPI